VSTPPERLAHIVWPSEAPVDEGRVPLAAYEGAPRPTHAEYLEARIAHPLASIAGELHAIREALAPGNGRPFSLVNGGNCDGSGNGFALYDGPRPGFLWRVELIVVSVTGASAAASVEVYNDGPTPDEANIVAYIPALSGASPSRGFLAPEAPAIVFGGNPVLVRVLGAVAGAQITCRIQGTSEPMGD
jgi:hypothetical protein